jgi:hypothetical protein
MLTAKRKLPAQLAAGSSSCKLSGGFEETGGLGDGETAGLGDLQVDRSGNHTLNQQRQILLNTIAALTIHHSPF